MNPSHLQPPQSWRNRSPGDLSVELPETFPGRVEECVAEAAAAFKGWRRLPWGERKQRLLEVRDRLAARKQELAALIALEVGKPLREARLEMDAVVAKFDWTCSDAERWLADEPVTDGPHPAQIRRRPRGVAAVIAPFNFPIHLGHGAAVAYLLAGNPVIFKPSPFAANVAAAYAREMQAVLPGGVFVLLQGGGEVGGALARHPSVRSVCFTGSVPVGTQLARDLAADYSKSLALELGGKNCLIVWQDADLDRAAEAAADGVCLTAGQRCNATSRILVHRSIEDAFLEKFLTSLTRFQPGHPSKEETTLGPLISQAAVERYQALVSTPGVWVRPGRVEEFVEGCCGWYVHPAVVRSDHFPFAQGPEPFAPVASVEAVEDFDDALERQSAGEYGLTAAVFTADDQVFANFASELEVGNLYRNLPTTFSPSSLPFGGLRASGNGRPGGRGFIRFAADEQALQWKVP